MCCSLQKTVARPSFWAFMKRKEKRGKAASRSRKRSGRRSFRRRRDTSDSSGSETKSSGSKRRRIRRRETSTKLSGLFGKKVVTAGPGETLAAVARRMQEHNVGTVVIVEDQRPVGIITDRDLALALGAQGIAPQSTAQKVMTGHVRTIPDDAGIYTATKCMRECEVRRLPVVDGDDRLVGIVSLDDLLRFLGREMYNLAEGIRHETEVK
jgi:CBS domain-containing protein